MFASVNYTTTLLLALIVIGLASLILSEVFLRRRRSRRQLVERVAELEALSAAGRAIVAAELDIDALCELIAGQAGHLVDNTTFQIGLFDNEFYEIRYWTIDGVKQPTPQRFYLHADGQGVGEPGGIIGWIRENHQHLMVRDFKLEMNTLPARPQYDSEAPPRSAVFVPLVSGDKAIGVIAAQSAQANRFSPQDLRRLSILSNQAAAAIANARLFAQEQTRAAHLELVSRIARQVNAVHDLDEICEQVVNLTRQTLGFHPVTIFEATPTGAELALRATSLPHIAANQQPAQGDLRAGLTLQARAIRLPMGRGIVGAAAAARQTVVVNDTTEDSRFLPNLRGMPAEATQATRSELAVPLLVNDELLGVLDVQSSEPAAFGPGERTFLETLAAEVANAIYRAGQLAREQQQAWITTAQLQVAETIGRHADLEEMLISVARLVPMLVGVSSCGFLLWNDDQQVYEGWARVDLNGDVDEAFGDLCLAVGDWNPLDAVHVGQQALTTAIAPPWQRGRPGAPPFPSACLRLYPLPGSRQENLGVMVVEDNVVEDNVMEDSVVAGGIVEGDNAAGDVEGPCDDPGRNDFQGIHRRRDELLQNVSRQIGAAVQSAKLRLAQQEEAWVNTAILQVAEAANSLTDLHEILDTVVRLVPLLVGVDSVFILIWDEFRQLFQAGPSYGVSAMGRGLVETLEIDREEFLSLSPQMAADFDTPGLRPPTSSHYAIRVPGWLETVLNATVAYNFPLVARGRLVGSMIVGMQRDSSRRTPFTLRRINIVNGIAHQAATAVVNNHLYKESAERARLQQELDVAHKIQASFLPEGNPNILGFSVAAFWRAARQVGGDFYDFLPLSDGKWGVVIADVADKGVPAALFMALSRTILRTVAFNREDPAQVLMRANEIIGKEAKSDLFVTLFYGVWDPTRNRFIYANAGHNPPLLMRTGGVFRPLEGNGMALGVLPEILLKSQAIELRPGDTLIFYTDGVTEALNEDYDEFGLERLHLAVRTAANRDAAAIVHSVTENVRDHVGDTPQFDDITLIAMKRLKM